MRLLPGVLILSLLLPGVSPAQDLFDGRVVTIGVVQDGPRGDDQLQMIEQELNLLLQENTRAVFKTAPAFNANWNLERLPRVLRAALEDPDVDIVLAVGPLVGGEGSRLDLNKPVVAAFIERPDLFHLHEMANDRSSHKNLSFVLVPQEVKTDILTFRNMVPFDSLYVVLAPDALDGMDHLADEARALENELGLRLLFRSVTADTAQSMAGFPPSTPAVLLTLTPELNEAQREALIAAFTARGIPTFSSVGHEDVRLGALAGRLPDLRRWGARRVAINLSEIIRGRSVEDLPVLLSVDPVLLINGKTAAALRYFPDLQTMTEAQFLDQGALLQEEQPLTVPEAFRLAEKANVALAIATEDVAISQQDKNLARSPMLPQVQFQPNYRWVNADALGLQGFPDHSVNLGLNASQMIYNDQIISDFRSLSRRLQSTEERREVERLNVLDEAGQAYFLLALAQILFQVEADNVALTQQNLELARLRLSTGLSGPDEVFRWEAELARQRSSLLNTRAVIQMRQIALNKVLYTPQGTLWDPEQVSVDPGVFPFLGGRLNGVFTSMATLPRLRQAIVDFALTDAPELKALAHDRESREIQLGQSKRRWWLPSFAALFDYRYQVYRDPDIEGQAKDLPLVEVRADYPIFTGGARSYEVKRSRSELIQINWKTDLARQTVEERTRTALGYVEASFPAIALNALAADRAKKNLDIVQEKYAQGLVSIVDLIDAQNQSFIADQGSAASVYKFLIDLLSLQRAISWFEDDKTPEERDEFARYLLDSIAEP